MSSSPATVPHGRLIVIEGADGTGKTTQLARLAERLEAAGHAVALYDFPSKEGSPVGDLIGSFLRGQYGSVTPEFLSLAFSIDRMQRKAAIVADLVAGTFVLCDRYVASNIAFQGAKIEDADRRRALDRLLRWIEYDVFALPHPDIEIAMVADDAYFRTGRHLVRSDDPRRAYSGGTADIHEGATDLQLAVNAYYRALDDTPSMRRLAIERDGERLDVATLADQVWDLVGALTGRDAADPIG